MTTIVTPDGTPSSRIAFGTMQWGDGASETEAQAMFEACLAAGINHFDTAFAYTDGQSETILGRLAAHSRDRLVIATKIGYVGRSDRGTLISQFDESRRRLAMDMVDILYLHRFDAETPLAHTLDVLADLVSSGQVRHVGLSNFAAWQVMKARMLMPGLPIDVLQPMFSLVKRQAEVEILPMAFDQGMNVFAYSPLGGGLLTGKYDRGEAGRLAHDPRYAARYRPDWMHRAATRLSTIAAETGHHPATLAVAWVANHPLAPCPIISARKPAQLAPSLAAVDLRIDQPLMARLSDLAPAPAPATDRLEET